MVLFNYARRSKLGKGLKPLRKKSSQLGTDNNSTNLQVHFEHLESVLPNISIVAHVSESISFNHNIDHATWELVYTVLVKKGMQDHFESVLGGGIKKDVAKYVLKRTAELLIWTYQHKSKGDLEEDSVMHWFQTLILDDYILVEPFSSKYLSGYRQLTPSTCLNYITDFVKAVNWFIWFRDNRDTEYKTEGASAGGILSICSKLKKSYKPCLRKQRLNKTLEHLVESDHFPSGGLVQLQEEMVDDIKWAKDINEHLVRTCHQSYNKFLSILIGAMYCESPQGRIGGNLLLAF
jgi:hypothetical protein